MTYEFKVGDKGKTQKGYEYYVVEKIKQVKTCFLRVIINKHEAYPFTIYGNSNYSVGCLLHPEETDVEEHCIEKQKVRDVILKEYNDENSILFLNDAIKNKLFKELKL